MDDLHVSYQAGAMKAEKEKMGLGNDVHQPAKTDDGTRHAKTSSDHVSGGASHIHESMPKMHDGTYKKA